MSAVISIQLLASFNRRWQRRAELFRRHAPVPAWLPDLVMTPEMHIQYELYLPLREWLHELRGIAMVYLPSSSWLPRLLRLSGGSCGLHSPSFTSLPDLWATLPPSLAGRVSFTPGELFPLFCALADPPRFGTAAGRYPRQLAEIVGLLAAAKPPDSWSVLDLGCGAGHGTYELVAALNGRTQRPVTALGVTLEPLEVWMARHRRLPHDPRPHRAYPPVPDHCAVNFVAGSIDRIPCAARFDLILANGIVGGPLFNCNHDRQLGALLSELTRCLAPGGLVSMANNFHAGFRSGIERIIAIARQADWECAGDPDLLSLRLLARGGNPGI